MRVTVDVKGEATHEIDLDDLESVSPAGPTAGEAATPTPDDETSPTSDDETTPTYADLLREIDLSPHEVSVLVDGRPVPEDQPVESDRVTVLRLIKGGAA
ncbi:ubiquitin-like small modifier protein SAMP2 [Haloterrigena alkaliphila]|uniref:MoaD/ThiS family protein n=1 Tax=Haloterrigena alkaliphila TaxID=2816475 RepID=A0A8A2VF08_9EURY|nr:ubiquitin-like small modifier protein 2 [Haloterrigena alkaliphila]QSX00640.1 MoaD/ThiS family protein [Haloterrigena alkaliphila]